VSQTNTKTEEKYFINRYLTILNKPAMKVAVKKTEMQEIDVTFPAYFTDKTHKTWIQYIRAEEEGHPYEITIYEKGDVSMMERPTIDLSELLGNPEKYQPSTREDFLQAVNSVNEFLKQFHDDRTNLLPDHQAAG
jgi:hypothetical protein